MMPATARVEIAFVLEFVSLRRLDVLTIGNEGALVREYVAPTSPNSAIRSNTFDAAPKDTPPPGDVKESSRVNVCGLALRLGKTIPGGRPVVEVVSDVL